MQLPPRLRVLIDTEQFLNSISMVDKDGNVITPGNWAHAPNAAHADTPPRPPLQPQISEPSSTTHPTNLEEINSVPPINNTFHRRHDHHLTWLTYCSTVAEFIPSMQDHMGIFEEIRQTIEAGTSSRRVLPRANTKAKALVSEVILGSTLLSYIMQKISVKNRTTLQVNIQVQREVIYFLRFKFMQSTDNVVERRRNTYKAAEKESSMRESHYIYTS